MKSIKKSNKIIITIFCVVAIILTLFLVLWNVSLKYLQPYRSGVNYYSDLSYSKFGSPFSRYGKIASEYLPEYDNVSENATDIEFLYCGGAGFSNTVDVLVAVKYPEEIYVSKRAEILQTGEDFGKDFHSGELDTRHHRVFEQKRTITGDYMYYVVTCCDKDNSITYSVMFDKREHSDMGGLSIHSDVYYTFFREFHTECIPS